MNLFSIFTPRIAAMLVKQGFPIIQRSKNLKTPQYPVYQFENTIEFQLAFDEIMKKEHQKHK